MSNGKILITALLSGTMEQGLAEFIQAINRAFAQQNSGGGATGSGRDGEDGMTPEPVWNGTKLFFRYPDGTTTTPVDLQGPAGADGADGADGTSGDATWADSRPTIVAWDKIPAGTSLDGLTLHEIIARQVYPFVEPAFSSFAVSTLSGTMEVGAQIAANGNATWAISNAANAVADTVTLKDHTGAVLFSNAALNASPKAITHEAWTSATAGTSTWTISAQSQSGATFSKTFRVTWLFKLFMGESDSATLDAAGVQALRSGTLKSAYAGNYSYQAGGYKWLAVPKNLGKPGTFKDVSNNLPVPMQDMGTISITNAHGIAQDYYVFRTSNVLGGSITIAVSV